MYKDKIYIHGNLIVNYALADNKDLESFDNSEFLATIRLEGTYRGQSAANFRVRIADAAETPDFLRGKKCTLFMSDLLDIVQRQGIKAGGEVSGRFCFCKRGSNYGIQLAED